MVKISENDVPLNRIRQECGGKYDILWLKQIIHKHVDAMQIVFQPNKCTMFMKDGLDGKKMQGKSESAMRTRSFRALKRAPT